MQDGVDVTCTDFSWTQRRQRLAVGLQTEERLVGEWTVHRVSGLQQTEERSQGMLQREKRTWDGENGQSDPCMHNETNTHL